MYQSVVAKLVCVLQLLMIDAEVVARKCNKSPKRTRAKSCAVGVLYAAGLAPSKTRSRHATLGSVTHICSFIDSVQKTTESRSRWDPADWPLMQRNRWHRLSLHRDFRVDRHLYAK